MKANGGQIVIGMPVVFVATGLTGTVVGVSVGMGTRGRTLIYTVRRDDDARVTAHYSDIRPPQGDA